MADEYQKREFSHFLSPSEGHLWFSIFSRPPWNKFTRVQRYTCCFVLLLTAMLLNILYYDQTAEANTKTSNSVAFGPLYISPEQVCWINSAHLNIFCDLIDQYWCNS